MLKGAARLRELSESREREGGKVVGARLREGCCVGTVPVEPG